MVRKSYTDNTRSNGQFPPKLTFRVAGPGRIKQYDAGEFSPVNADFQPVYDAAGTEGMETDAARFKIMLHREAQGHDGPFDTFEVEMLHADPSINGKIFTISTGGRNLIGNLMGAYQEDGAGVCLDVIRVPNTGGGNANWYRIDGVDESAPEPAAPQQSANGSKPTTASGWSEMYRHQFDNFPPSEKRNANLAKIISTAAVDGFTFIEQEVRFVSVTTDDVGDSDEPDDLPF